MTQKAKLCLEVIIQIPAQTIEDGSLLSFGAGRVRLKKDEWFNIEDVIEVFSRFNQSQALPESIYWREIKVLNQNGS
ncbi:hypothetical protein J3P77_12980 [Pseudomonas sp. R1-18]|uniref:hypothetical protein n=1 Tax=Pseudomonas sp. R1-18 TaxID=1632772 RepID=UPI003DA9042E